MHASKPSSSTTHAHFSAPPAIPTTRQPLIFASWPTVCPTAPAAPDTTRVSPAFGWPTSISPKYAVIPGMPSTLSHWPTVPIERSIFEMSPRATCFSLTVQYSCRPGAPATRSPSENAVLRDAITVPMPPARITAPISTGAM